MMATQSDHELLYAADCPLCGRNGTVVSPDYCSEGHGDECPDRICLQCGGALAVALIVAPEHRDSVRTARTA